PRHEAERALQATDLRDLPGRPRGDGAHPVLRRGSPLVGVRLSAPRQRLAQLPRGDRAPDATPVAGDAPQADPRQCGRALRADAASLTRPPRVPTNQGFGICGQRLMLWTRFGLTACG